MMPYYIRTRTKDEAFEHIDVLISRLKELVAEEQEGANFVVVEKVDGGYMEVALGLGNLSIINYTPEDEDEPSIVTCNATIDRAKSDEIKIKDLSEEDYQAFSSNTIPMEQALQVVRRYLEGESFTDLCDWYMA